MKKKKLTYNSLALGNLKNRKKHYILLIIAIILSTIFSSSIIYFAFSAYCSVVDKAHSNLGYQDCIMTNADEEILSEAIEKDYIKEIGYAHILGFAYTDDENKIDGTSVAWLDNEAKALANPVLLKGDYPQKKGEIAIEQSALMRLGLNAEIGDTITLKFSPQNKADTLDVVKEKEYVLCGILKNKHDYLINELVGGAPNTLLPAAFVYENEELDPGGKEALVSYYTFNPKIESDIIFRFFSTENDVYEKNIDLAYTYASKTFYPIGVYTNAYSALPETQSLVEKLIYILIVVVILLSASAMGIINAFTSDLKERKKQIGMYRAVGATKNQIIKLFGREALILSLICTPLSLTISFFLVKFILTFVDKDAIFKPNLWVLLSCGVFSTICIMVASLIPLIGASRIAPMQAIRKIDTARKLKNAKIKSKENFTVAKLISKRNITVSKGKLITVSIFLVISIIFSSYLFSFLEYAKNDIYGYGYDYNLEITQSTIYEGINFADTNNGFSENHKNEVLNCEYVDSAYGVKIINANILVDEMTNYLKIYNHNMYQHNANSAEDAIQKLKNQNLFNELNDYSSKLKEGAGYDEFFSTNILAFDEETLKTFEKSVTDGKIDIEKLNSGEEIILCAPQKAYLQIEEYYDNDITFWTSDSFTEQYDNYSFVEDRTLKAGDIIDISVLTSSEEGYVFDFSYNAKIKETRKTVTIGAIVEVANTPFLTIPDQTVYAITTIDGLNHFAKNVRYGSLAFNLSKPCTEEIDKEISEILKTIELTVLDSRYVSDYEYKQKQKESYQSITLVVLAIVILFFTICASIINNTITTNIRNDKKKIGTLRAVGADNNVIFSCYIKQLLSMFKWGYLLGFGGFLISYIAYYLFVKFNDNDLYMVFSPWFTIIIGFVVFVFCSLKLWLKVKKETKNSIVENIREL